MNYQQKKNKIAHDATLFSLNDDLCLLANILIISREILKSNKFPLEEYKKWLKKNK